MNILRSAALAVSLLISLGLLFFGDDESDFAAAPTASWQRVSAIGLASFSFAGGVATLAGAPVPLEQAPFIGRARGAVLETTEFADGAVSVDVVTWSAPRVFTSVITRIGTNRGYSGRSK